MDTDAEDNAIGSGNTVLSTATFPKDQMTAEFVMKGGMVITDPLC